MSSCFLLYLAFPATHKYIQQALSMPADDTVTSTLTQTREKTNINLYCYHKMNTVKYMTIWQFKFSFLPDLWDTILVYSLSILLALTSKISTSMTVVSVYLMFPYAYFLCYLKQINHNLQGENK